jgi:chromosome segregation ATPase
MDVKEEITVLRSHIAQLEDKLKGQRRELDTLKKQVATLQEVVSELERQLEDEPLT